MIERKEIQPYLNKKIGVLFWDSGKELFTRGFLLNVTENTINIKTEYNIHIISLQNITKIKIPL